MYTWLIYHHNESRAQRVWMNPKTRRCLLLFKKNSIETESIGFNWSRFTARGVINNRVTFLTHNINVILRDISCSDIITWSHRLYNDGFIYKGTKRWGSDAAAQSATLIRSFSTSVSDRVWYRDESFNHRPLKTRTRLVTAAVDDRGGRFILHLTSAPRLQMDFQFLEVNSVSGSKKSANKFACVTDAKWERWDWERNWIAVGRYRLFSLVTRLLGLSFKTFHFRHSAFQEHHGTFILLRFFYKLLETNLKGNKITSNVLGKKNWLETQVHKNRRS